jgi:hypothetical protein
VPFNNITTAPTNGTFSGGVFTATTAGTYMITFSLAATSNGTTVAAQILHGSAVTTVVAVGAGQATPNFTTGSLSRSNVSAVVVLAATNTITLQAVNPSTSATNTISSDGTTRVTIVKLN